MAEKNNQYLPIIEMLNGIFGDYKSHNENTGQMSFCCPVCSYEIKGLDKLDGKYNLEINYFFGVAKCWACGESHNTHGTLRHFIKQYGNKQQLKKYDLLRPDRDSSFKKVYNPVRLPKEFISFTQASEGIKKTHYYKQAISYLRQRNITDEMIKNHHIGFCYSGEYANRIIIPSYDENFYLNYFVGRSYESRAKQKYKNPVAEKDVIIWNERLIDWDEPIFIVEGPFDSIFLPNSIPMLGKVMSETLFAKLYENAQNIIIVMDGDAYEDAVKLYHKLNGGRLFGKVWIVELPQDKDIADLKGNLDGYEVKQLD